MRPRSSSKRIAPAAVSMALAAAFLAPAAGAITPAEMNPHRQTLADVEAVGGAMFAWIVDQVGFGPGGVPLGTSFDVTDFPPITHAALQALLVPTYIAAVPELDGWGNPYDYRLDTANPLGLNVALIRSAGEDAAYEGTVYAPGDFVDLAGDPVWASGVLARRPGPPLLDYRSRQARNMSQILQIGTAMFSWYVDQVGLTPRTGGPGEPGGGTVDLSLFTPITAPALEALLAPSYIRFLLPADAWGGQLDLYLDTEDLLGPEVMAIRSRGRSGVAEGDVYTVGTFDAASFASDMVWADGVWVRSADLSNLIFYDDFETGDTRFWSASMP